MTSNQVAFYRAQKDYDAAIRNLAETNRANIARETETHRNNVASLNESIRHNIETEFNVKEQNRINSLNQREQARHNAALESIQREYNRQANAIGWENAYANMRQASVAEKNASTAQSRLTSVEIPVASSTVVLNKSRANESDTSAAYNQGRVSLIPIQIEESQTRSQLNKTSSAELSHRLVQNWFKTAFQGAESISKSLNNLGLQLSIIR